jgi:hypothetical protein
MARKNEIRREYIEKPEAVKINIYSRDLQSGAGADLLEIS